MPNKIVFIKAALICPDPACRHQSGQCIKCLARIIKEEFENPFSEQLELTSIQPQLPQKTMARDDREICDEVGFDHLKTKAKIFQMTYV